MKEINNALIVVIIAAIISLVTGVVAFGIAVAIPYALRLYMMKYDQKLNIAAFIKYSVIFTFVIGAILVIPGLMAIADVNIYVVLVYGIVLLLIGAVGGLIAYWKNPVACNVQPIA